MLSLKNVCVGDVVTCDFPSHDGKAMARHFCLVLEVSKTHLYVAYGSSKKVDCSSPAPTEIVIADDEEIKACGMFCKSRFDLAIRASVSAKTCAFKGRLPRSKYVRLFEAAKAAHIA
jgi:hypothetical protein